MLRKTSRCLDKIETEGNEKAMTTKIRSVMGDVNVFEVFVLLLWEIRDGLATRSTSDRNIQMEEVQHKGDRTPKRQNKTHRCGGLHEIGKCALETGAKMGPNPYFSR